MDNFSQFEAVEASGFNENLSAVKSRDRKILRKLSFLSGTAVILYVFIQNFIVAALEGAGLIDLYTKNSFFQSGIDILLILLGVLLPFTLMGKRMQKISGEAEPVMTARTP